MRGPVKLHPNDQNNLKVAAMANPLPVPAARVDEAKRPKADAKVTKPVSKASNVAAVSSAGPRRLIRPSLGTGARREFLRRSPASSISLHPGVGDSGSFPQEASHAETFYLQKQAQSQTLIVFVLEDGEQIEGYIEWYDRDVIKVRNGARTLIYKSSIKYLYKAGDHLRV
ncbi:MAG TPA: RNA chaperone Hfq [Acidobacteriaceae bacterium]|nr:RNA chaperone Hfq [Acidobacteriaceae bacterium]